MTDTEEAGRRRIRGPRTRRQAVAGVLALLFLAGAAGYALGRPRPPGAGSVDVGFLQDMVVHHEQAVELALLALDRTSEPVVRSFAKEVVVFQQYEIGLMEAYLRRWGRARYSDSPTAMAWMGAAVPRDRMPGMASESQLTALREANGRDADRLFLELLVEHHRGGVHMGLAAAAQGRDREVKALAARIARVQRTEIEELRATRHRLGL